MKAEHDGGASFDCAMFAAHVVLVVAGLAIIAGCLSERAYDGAACAFGLTVAAAITGRARGARQ